jgi:hypothetical protein
MFITSDASAQIIGCTDLFITEYIEGTGNNKCLELFNPTSEAIDLSEYEVQRWGNGEAGMTDATQLFGTLPPLTTWVLVNGQTEDVDLGGGAISPACDPALQLLADQLDNPYPAPTYMNGDDAIVIVKNGSEVIDIFGKPGEDPGTAWTDDAENGYVDVGDGATWLTSNHTLRRKFEVGIGVTVPPVSFNTFLEWDTLEVNTWDGLGHHSCVCGSTAIEAINILPQEANIFPNPSDNGLVTVETSAEVELLEVYSPEGKLVYSETPAAGVRKWNFNSTDWQAGIYFVNLKYTQGTTYAHRVVIR